MQISLVPYQQLWRTYLSPLRGKVALLGVLLIAGIGMELAGPLLTAGFIDGARAGAAARTLLWLAITYLLVGISGQACNAVGNYVAADVGWLATNQLRGDLVRHCLALELSFHHAHTPGEMIERIDGDITKLSNLFSVLVFRILGSVLKLIGALIVLYLTIHWLTGLSMTVFVLLAFYVLLQRRMVAIKAFRAEREAIAVQYGFLEERLGGMEDLRANGATAYVLRRFLQIARPVFFTMRGAAMARAGMWLTAGMLFALGTVTMLGFGAYLFSTGHLSLGCVVLLFQYRTMLYNPLEQITRQLQDLQEAGASIGRVQELFALRPAITDGPGAQPADAAIAFEQVTFCYHPEQPVLHNISFQLAPGRTLGLLGRTGSGKSTLTRLLFRLYDVEQGCIRLGGVDLRAMRQRDLRRQIGMVTQDVQLFQASVRDNLTFFDPDIPDERILKVISEMELQEWYDALPHGLDTRIEAGGAGLSAGQAQLLAFTRVFLTNPRVVLLDEPSSRLDPATERLVERAVAELLAGRTCIIIAHRLATVQHVDEIMILHDGQVLEYGERTVLAADPDSHFSQLLQAGLEKEMA